MAEQNAIIVKPHGRIVLVVVQAARMDEEVARQMQTGVVEAAAQNPERPVVLDLAAVDFLPSLSIGVLVTLLRKFKQEGQRFLLVGLQPAVRETLTVCRLIRVFEIYGSVEDALEKLNRPA